MYVDEVWKVCMGEEVKDVVFWFVFGICWKKYFLFWEFFDECDFC